MVLKVDHLRKSYGSGTGRVTILDGVSLDLSAGEALALTGESGSGKSTLLHLIGGLDQPDAGDIDISGQRLSGLNDAGRAALRRTQVGVIFQQFNLVPSLTVGDNIRFHGRLAGRDDPARAMELAEKLGIADQLGKYPEALSGGQQQRVAIARTLAASPALILADEPTGNLDEASADRVFDLMLELAAETGAGLLLVTHSSRLAVRAGRRLHLSHGQLREAA